MVAEVACFQNQYNGSWISSCCFHAAPFPVDAAVQPLYASVLCPEFLQCTIMHPAWCIIIQDQHRSSRVQAWPYFWVAVPCAGGWWGLSFTASKAGFPWEARKARRMWSRNESIGWISKDRPSIPLEEQAATGSSAWDLWGGVALVPYPKEGSWYSVCQWENIT